MIRLIAACLATILVATPVDASTCPDRDRSDERATLLAQLANSPDQTSGKLAANAVWLFWHQAPDEVAQSIFDRAMDLLHGFDYAAAEVELNTLLEYCPNFAEAWNQRAFVRFLRENFEGSLADIDETLAREPAHFGALSGQAQIFFRTGRAGLAQRALRQAVRVHPWLSERALLTDEGEDI